MDVVIVGAGLAGLTAGALLRDSGAEFTIVEADTHVGGRIQSVRDPDSGSPLADLGPTWVWPKYQPVVSRWIGTLRLKTFEQYNHGDAVMVGYGPEPIRQPLPGQDGMVRIVGGPVAIIDSLLDQIDPSAIQVSTPVVGIDADGPDRVRVCTGSNKMISARRVIVATPLRIAASTLGLSWASNGLLAAMESTPTWMSTHAKAVALYDRPFWRDDGLSGRIASRGGPLVEAHDHSGHGDNSAAIFGFVGWPVEARRTAADGLRSAIVDQLVECFGPAASDPLDLIVQDWASKPYIVSDRDISSPPNHPVVGPAALWQGHLDGRVHFAVSETSDISPGLIEGALAAGERAATAVLQSIN